jgi:hypothetical protein
MVSPCSPGLKVENLVNTFSGENMVAALDPLHEPKPPEKPAKVVKSDARIRRAPQYSHQNGFGHTSLCTHGQLCAFRGEPAGRASQGEAQGAPWGRSSAWITAPPDALKYPERYGPVPRVHHPDTGRQPFLPALRYSGLPRSILRVGQLFSCSWRSLSDMGTTHLCGIALRPFETVRASANRARA